jgi:uncharacterized protein YfdQ (DUF2303 family)
VAEELNDKAIAAIAKLTNAGAKPIDVPGGNTPVMVIPNDMKVVSLAEFVYNDRSERPIRMKGTVKVLDGDSFLKYWNLFSDANSRVFADEEKESVLAILDYHGSGSDGAPRWGQHRIEINLRKAREWNIWKGQSGKKVTQMDFAEFLEDNAPDIVDPPAATMLEVARDLKATTDGSFNSSFEQKNGSVNFKYSEETKGTYGKQNVEVPDSFKVSIPVHIGGDRITITARLRYRVNAGKLVLWFDLLRAEEIEHKAFLQIEEKIKAGVGDIINGSPA